MGFDEKQVLGRKGDLHPQGKFHYAAQEVNFAREQLLEGKYVIHHVVTKTKNRHLLFNQLAGLSANMG